MSQMNTTEELTAEMYELYCKKVGGVAFNGDPLPDWAEFGSDPNKTKQADAWRTVAKEVLVGQSLNAAAKAISNRMTAQGFWDDWDFANKKLKEMDASNDVLDLSLALRRALISEKLMLIITEPAEGMEAHRKNKKAVKWEGSEDLLHLPDESDPEGRTPFEQHFKDTFEDEIADTFIRLLDLCGKLDIDIDFHIRHKSIYNESRPHKHEKNC